MSEDNGLPGSQARDPHGLCCKQSVPQQKNDAFSSLLLSILGADKSVAAKNWEDGPILTTLAAQLIGTFFLLFALQSAAFYVLSNNVWIGLFMGCLSAFLITSADRILISGDWYIEGEYWYLYHRNPNDDRLKEITLKRWMKMGVRYLIGIVISVSIVTIAAPALFTLEIETHLDKYNFNELNREAVNDGVIYSDAKADSHRQAKEYQESIKRELDERNRQLSNITSNLSSDQIISSLNIEVKKLKDEIDVFDKEILLAKTFEEQERLGIKSSLENNKGIQASGRRGCGELCLYWQSQAKQYALVRESSIQKLHNAESQLEERIILLSLNKEDEIEKISAEISALRQQYDSAKISAELARDEWLGYKDERMAKIGNEYGIAFEKAGLRRIMDAYDELINGASDSAKTMLLLLKVFAVFLETIVFTSRLFGTSRNYSCALYEKHMLKWSNR